jgi:tetratricopeptide (TPR) repeat protein
MSGAAVFAAGYLIGVVGQHHLREGLGRLTVRPLQLPPGNDLGVSPEMVREWGKVLPQLRSALPVVTPSTARELAALRAQRMAAKLTPTVLVERQVELAKLASFSVRGESPWRWVQAPAFSGKTALLAWFALHPPGTVDIAACFLQMTTTDNTASYALTVLNSQLAALLGRAQYQPPTEITDRISDFLDDLLRAAAARAQQLGRRLLLVVDGLDEYSQEETHPLGSWLPDAASLPEGVAVLVSSRAGVPVSLPAAHPLRSAVDAVAPSAAATELRALATRELNDAVKAEPELRYEILACLAACGGGISSEGLWMWLARRGHPVQAEYLDTQINRWYHRTVRVAEDPDRLTGDTLAFSHDTLREAAERTFHKSIPQLRGELHAWAQECRGEGWPDSTPAYLLTVYPRLLAQIRDTARLTALALDGPRHVCMFTLTGGDAAALDEVRAAQSLLLSANDPDLLSIGLLARHRDDLAVRNWSTPTELPGLWAALGRPARGLSIARAIPDPAPRARAFTGLVRPLAAAGDREGVVNAAGLAQAAAARVIDSGEQSRLLTDLVDVLAVAHEFRLAQNAAMMIANKDDQAPALAQVTRMSAVAGEYDIARLSAAMITNREARAAAYAALVGAIADDKNYELARGIAITIRYRDARARALAALVKALALSRRDDQAAEVADLARSTAVKIAAPETRASALTDLVEGLAAGARERGRTAPLVDRAVAIATTIAEPREQTRALIAAAGALATVGNRERALSCTEMISNMQDRALALAALAQIFATAGNHEDTAQAAALARGAAAAVTDLGARVWTLATLFEALAAAGAHEQAASAADLAEASAAAIAEPSEQQWAIIQLTSILDGAGERSRAARVIAQLPPPSGIPVPEPFWSPLDRNGQSRTATVLISALVQVGQTDRAIRLAHFTQIESATFSDPYGEPVAFRALIEALAAVGEDDVANAMSSSHPVQDRATAALTVPAESLASESQHDVFDNTTMDTFEVGRILNLTRALAWAGEYVLAENFVRTFTKPGTQGTLLAALAAALADTNENERAEAVAASIADPYWKIQAITIVAEALAACGHDRVVRLADLAVTSAAALHPHSQVQALTALAKALAAAGDRDRAGEFAGRALTAAAAIPQPFRQAQALTAMAKALAAAGDRDRAVELAELAWTTTTNAPTTTTANLYAEQGPALAAAVEVLANADELERAQEHAIAMLAIPWVGRPCQERAFTAVMDALTATSDHARARTVATSIPDPYWTALALATSANVLADGDDREQASRLADLAYAAATTVSDRDARADALTTLASAFAASGEYDRAQAVATSITNPSAQARALTALVRTLGADGHKPLRQVVELAQTAATRIRSPKAQAEALIPLVETLAAVGDHKRATKLARLAHAAATGIANPRTQAQVLADLVPALVAAGEYELAQATAISIGDAYSKRKALTDLAKAFAAAHEYDRAYVATTSITAPRARSEAMTGLVEALAATTSRPKHERAQAAATAITDPYWKARAVTAATRAFTADGDRERARQLAELALATAASVIRLDERAQVLASLTEVLATAGEYERALTAATKITGPNGQAEALTAVATAAARKGDIRQSRLALTQAWTAGSWEIPLLALAAVDAEVLRQLSEVEAPRGSQ